MGAENLHAIFPSGKWLNDEYKLDVDMEKAARNIDNNFIALSNTMNLAEQEHNLPL